MLVRKANHLDMERIPACKHQVTSITAVRCRGIQIKASSKEKATNPASNENPQTKTVSHQRHCTTGLQKYKASRQNKAPKKKVPEVQEG